MALPKTITSDVYIIKCPITGKLSMCMGEMKEYGYITISVQEVTLEVPQDVDLTALKIDALKTQQEHLKLDTDNKVSKIESEIQELLKTK